MTSSQNGLGGVTPGPGSGGRLQAAGHGVTLSGSSGEPEADAVADDSGGEMPVEFLREYFMELEDGHPAGGLMMYQPGEGHDRMIMHRMFMHQSGGVGFWNFHERGRVLPGSFQMANGLEHNFCTQLDRTLRRFVYRGAVHQPRRQ